jgi:error-prone DNA polymerase
VSAPYAELQATSHYSFLRGASSCEELFATAAHLGLPALAITDRNSLAGAVKAREAARVTKMRFVLGCRLDLTGGPSVLVYPSDKAAYSRLTRLLTVGKRRAGKSKCDLTFDDLAASAEGMLAVLLGDKPSSALVADLGRLRDAFGPDGAHLALTRRFRADEHQRLDALADIARHARVATVATNDVLYHSHDQRILHDVMTCIREKCTIDDAGFRRERSSGRFLRPPDEMERLFARYPKAFARTLEIAERCRFSLDELQYTYPTEVREDGLSAQEKLEGLTWAGVAERYPGGVPSKVDDLLRHELALIAKLQYAPYFLTVESIVRFARSRGILCQGRGSAANSAVCYVLGITSIDPERNDVLFERFVSAERAEPPDIDVDFEHARREEVIQWVYDTYGRDRAALAATVICYRARYAVREVGKALGLTEDLTGQMARMTWAWDDDGVTEERVKELGLTLEDRRLRLCLELTRQLMHTPRHIGQHPGGFILTLDRLDDMVAIEPAAMENRQVVEWDKNDLDALGFMKVDCLGLGMLGCLRKCFDLLAEHKGIEIDLSSIPQDDPATYDMICRADTIGVFQIESRAQMSMLPRLKPRTLDDLTIEVAVVRPGPIQGQMVHPYLRRREGIEPVVYPTPEFEKVLGKTLGVPLFQEQAMGIAIHCAGFSPGEADELRRAMATFKYTGGVSHFRSKLIGGMIANGYDPEFAERTFSQLEGFGSYGFPMSHAASFAILAYASSWMKHHHPDVFLCGILNSLPMGFYDAAQLVGCARRHGVEVRRVCVNASQWDCTLEPSSTSTGRFAVRLGLLRVKGLSSKDGEGIVAASAHSPFRSVEELQRRSAVRAATLDKLAKADAFLSLGLSRRDAEWEIRALRDMALPLFVAANKRHNQSSPEIVEPCALLKPAAAGREVVDDYAATGLSLRAHPVGFLRDKLARRGVMVATDLAETQDGRRVKVAGLVLVRQRPGSAKGVMFITLEDETGPLNVIVWPSLFERFRRVVFSAVMMGVEGRLQREGDVIHVIADRLVDLSEALRRVGGTEGAFQLSSGRGDEVRTGGGVDQRSVTKLRDIYIPDLRFDSGVKVKTGLGVRVPVLSRKTKVKRS